MTSALPCLVTHERVSRIPCMQEREACIRQVFTGVVEKWIFCGGHRDICRLNSGWSKVGSGVW